MSDENVDVITVGRISLDFYANESNVGFEKIKTFTMSIGGSPTNVAIAAARLGNKSAIVTNIGKDSFNEYIISKLKDFKVNTDFVGVDETEFTPAVFAAMDDPFDPTIFFNRAKSAPDTKVEKSRLSDELVKKVKIFWVSACALAQGETGNSLKSWLAVRNNATHTILDLDYRPSFWESEAVAKKVTLEAISKSTVLVGNRREFEVVSGLTDPKKISEHYLGDQISTVIVKLGEQGVYLSAKGEEYLLPPLKVDVRCGLGAGDGFGGMLIHGLLNSWSLEKIGSYANVAGAIVASRLMCSDAMPTMSEVEAMVKEKV